MIILGLITLILIMIAPAFPQEQGNLDSEEYIFSIMSSDDLELMEAAIVIKKRGQWFFPMEETIRALGFYIEGSKLHGSYKGFIRSESNIFALNSKTCEIYFQESNRKIDCSDFFLYEDEWFVKQNILEDIFDVKFRIEVYKSLIIIDSKIPLPREVQERIKANRKKKDFDHNQAPIEVTPYEWVDGFNLYQRAQNRHASADQGRISNNHFTHDLYLNTELAKMSVKSNVTGINGNYKANWFSLSKNYLRDKEDHPLALSYYELGNLKTYATPYLVSSDNVGVNFSNKDFSRTSNFLTQDFQGDLRTGWVMELYLNDELIATAQPNENQRYLITNIPLTIGLNRIHYIFYGPFGDIEHRYENYVVDSSMLSTKPIEYNLAAGQTDEGQNELFLNLDGRLNSTNRLSMYYQKSDIDRFQGDLKGILLSQAFTFSYAHSEEGSLHGITLNKRFNKLNIFSRYTNYNGYTLNAQEKEQVKDRELFTSSNLYLRGGFQIGLDHLHIRNVESESSNEFTSRLGLGFTHFFLGNTATFQKDHLNGEFFIRFHHHGKFLHRISNFYSKDSPVDRIQWQTSYDTSENRFKLTLEKSLKPQLDSIQLSGEKKFKNFVAFSSLTGNSEQDYSVNVGAGALLTYDLKTNHTTLIQEKNAETAQLVARAFLDLNENNKKDEGEPPLTGVIFKNSQNLRPAISGEKGFARMYGLTPNQSIELEVDTQKLPNFYHQPKILSKQLLLRSGKTTHIEYPFVVKGEIFGTIQNYQHFDNVSVHLFKENQKLSVVSPERDGYFIIEDFSFKDILRLKLYDNTSEEYIFEKIVQFEGYENPATEINF